MMKEPPPTLRIKVHKIRGYCGLPEQFIVESQHGWLVKDGKQGRMTVNGFTSSLSQATVFASERNALLALHCLFPHNPKERVRQ